MADHHDIAALASPRPSRLVDVPEEVRRLKEAAHALRERVGKELAVGPAHSFVESSLAKGFYEQACARWVDSLLATPSARAGDQDEDQGASSGPGSREPSPPVSASGFDPSRTHDVPEGIDSTVHRVAEALRASCLKEFGSNWCYDVAWEFARVAIRTYEAQRSTPDTPDPQAPQETAGGTPPGLRRVRKGVLEISPDGGRTWAAYVAAPPPVSAPTPQGGTETLREALAPFAGSVFNDNGDLTITTSGLSDEDWLRAYRAYRAALSSLAQPDQGVERVRHVKRGTEYEVLFRGVELQVATNHIKVSGDAYEFLEEGHHVVIYRGADGKLWAREEAEFDDGRFERLDRAAPSPSHEEA